MLCASCAARRAINSTSVGGATCSRVVCTPLHTAGVVSCGTGVVCLLLTVCGNARGASGFWLLPDAVRCQCCRYMVAAVCAMTASSCSCSCRGSRAPPPAALLSTCSQPAGRPVRLPICIRLRQRSCSCHPNAADAHAGERHDCQVVQRVLPVPAAHVHSRPPARLDTQ